MHLTVRNVAQAFAELVRLFWANRGPFREGPSRDGPVRYLDEPITVTYLHPRERVLLNPARDANPFFHVYDALWTLVGRDDVAPLAWYNSRMTQYSDDGQTFNGAYGFRWRNNTGRHTTLTLGDVPHGIWSGRIDQLKVIIDHLRRHPTSRRAVLQMWNVEEDLLRIEESRDVCCNLSALPAVRDGALDLTVFNRSNDLVWGLTGANAVQFSILQEYLATHLGLQVGRYHQVTNNLHVYLERWAPEAWLTAERTEYHEPLEDYTLVPLVKDPATFDRELPRFVEQAHSGQRLEAGWDEPFFGSVAVPLARAFTAHKAKDPVRAVRWAEMCADDGWRTAAVEWLERRARKGVPHGGE